VDLSHYRAVRHLHSFPTRRSSDLVIPGKSVIGLEIPNVNREIVYLSEILRSDKYDQIKSPLALALGKDIGGAPIVVDLAKMPHRSEEHTSELQSRENLVCRLLLEK